jgi:hypothetical protein
VRRPALVAIAVVAMIVAACNPREAPVEPVEPVDPIGDAHVVCLGVSNDMCQLAVDSIDGPPEELTGTRIVRIEVRCTLPACTETDGDAEVTLYFADGQQWTAGHSWTSAPPVEALPPPVRIEPTCIGVPFQMCHDLSVTGPEGHGIDASVKSVTVRCSAVCTPEAGSGQTIYEFIDARPSVSIDWAYGDGG